MDKLNAILNDHVAVGDDTKDKILGAAFVVVDKNGPLFSGSAGRRYFDRDSPPFQPDSWTWLASVTKLVTVVAVMQLVENGTLGLDDDVRERLPQLGELQVLKGFDDDGKPVLEDTDRVITLKHLLTHTVGLGSDLADPDLMRWSKAVGRTATCMDWSLEGNTTPLRFHPGDGFYYGTATDWAGCLLEKVTGQTLGAYVQAHILDPVGMPSTGFWPEKLPGAEDRSVAWTYRQEDGSLKPGPDQTPREHPLESGGSGLFSTAEDYGKFLAALLAGKLVARETVELMFAPQLNEAQQGMLMMIANAFRYMFAPEFTEDVTLNYGLGGLVNVVDSPGKRNAGSMMWSGAVNGRWWIDPKAGIAAVLIPNLTPHGDAVIARLYDALERAVYEDLLPGRSA